MVYGIAHYTTWMIGKMIPDFFSVIIPVFNSSHTVVEALNSVKAQTYRPIEIIVVDDGSTDDTQFVVECWMQKNAEGDSLTVRYFRQENFGAGAARNTGLKHCRGEYIQFLDADDLLHPNRFELAYEVFQTTSCEYLETGFEGFYERIGDLREIHYGHEGRDLVEWLLRGRLWPNAIRNIYRRSLIERTGPWAEWMEAFEDYEYAIRALVRNPKVKTASIKKVLAFARRHLESGRSAILRTRKGRELRVYCEALLCERVKECDYIPYEWKQALASRLYALGFRCHAQGWTDLGWRCGEMAASLGVELDAKGKLRYLAWRGGRIGGLIYLGLGKLKRILMEGYCVL